MSWTKNTANGFEIGTESLTLPDSEGSSETNVHSSVLDGSKFINKKFIVYLEVTETSTGDGALDIAVRGSLDGSTYVDLDASTVSDVDPTGTNKAAAVADLTDIEVPYIKLEVFSDGTDTQDDATVKVGYAVKP